MGGLLGGGGGGWLARSRHCASIRTPVPFHYSSMWPPSPTVGVPGAFQARLHGCGRCRVGAGGGWLKKSQTRGALRRPLGTLGPLLGDHCWVVMGNKWECV